MKWYNWPATRQNNYAPLRLIVWRMFWFLPFLALLSLLCGVVAVGWGPRTAEQLWNYCW